MKACAAAVAASCCGAALAAAAPGVTPNWWPGVDGDLVYGSQPTVPAVDAGGLVYLAGPPPGGVQCGGPSVKAWAVPPGAPAAQAFSAPAPVPPPNGSGASPWCVDFTAAATRRVSVGDAALAPTAGVVAVGWTGVTADRASSGAIVSAVRAGAAGGGAPAWAALLAAGPAVAGTTSLQALVPLSGGGALAAVVNAAGGGTTVYVLNAATGAVVESWPLPAAPPPPTPAVNCTSGLAGGIVHWAVNVGGGGSGEYLVVDATSPGRFGGCTYAVRLDTGALTWAAPWGGAGVAPVAISPSATGGPAVAAFPPAATLGGPAGVAAVRLADGAPLWTAPLPGRQNYVAGAGASPDGGSTLFLLASYSVWRGCAAPVGFLHALDVASNGSVVATLTRAHFPDAGVQAGGALPAVVAASGGAAGDAVVVLRETDGRGTYDAYATAVAYDAAARSLTVASSVYGGAGAGLNVAHDDGGANPVRGCPPAVEAPQGSTGAAVAVPGGGGGGSSGGAAQLVVADWAGLAAVAL